MLSNLFKDTYWFDDREKARIFSASGSAWVIIKVEKFNQLRPGSQLSQNQGLQSCWKERKYVQWPSGSRLPWT